MLYLFTCLNKIAHSFYAEGISCENWIVRNVKTTFEQYIYIYMSFVDAVIQSVLFQRNKTYRVLKFMSSIICTWTSLQSYEHMAY